GIATHDASCTCRELGRREQRFSEKRGLVSADAPGQAARLELHQDRLKSWKQPRLSRKIRAVQLEKPGTQALDVLWAGVGKSDPDQGKGTVRDVRSNLVEGDGWPALFLAQAIESQGHVGCRVEQGAIEVEQHAGDAYLRGHQAPARVRWAR